MRYRLHSSRTLLPIVVMFFLFMCSVQAQFEPCPTGSTPCSNCFELEMLEEPVVIVDGNCDISAGIAIDITPNLVNPGQNYPTWMIRPGTAAVGCNIVDVGVVGVTDNINGTVVPVPANFMITLTNPLTSGPLNSNGQREIRVLASIQTDCGQCTEIPYLILIEDGTAPTFVNCPDNITISCVDPFPGVPVVDVDDNCFNNATANYQGQTGSSDQCAGGAFVRTWTFTDFSNVTQTCTQTITVTPDNQAPTISTGNNFLGDLGDFCSISNVFPTYGGVQGIEIGEGVDIVDCTPDAVMGFTMVDTQTGGTGCPLDYLRTYTITDACGNALVLTSTFRVNDVDPPVITAQPANQVDNCNSSTGTATAFSNWIANAGGATASDSCGGGLTTTVSPNPGTLPACPNGDYTFTFTFTDDCGNSVTTNPATYTINDSTAPAVSGGSPMVIPCTVNYLDMLSTWLADGGGTAGTDACSGPPTLSYQINGMTMTAAEIQALLNADVNDTSCADGVVAVGHPGGIVDDVLGSVEVTFVYTDLCNNLPSASQQIKFIVTDSGVPNIVSPAQDAGDNCSNGNASATLTNWLVAAGNAVATDDCGGTITWCATPQNGPLAGTQIVTNSMVTYGGDIQDILMTTTPGCGTGTVTVDFIAKDACGNVSATSTSATFNLTDNVGPAITTFPTGIQVDCSTTNPGAELSSWLAINGGSVVSDDCSTSTIYYFLAGEYNPFTDNDNNPGNDPGVNQVSINDLSDGCGPTGNLSVEWFYFDACGNYTTSGPVGFSVIDNTPPMLNNPAMDITMECDGGGNTGGITNWLNNNGGATASDLCGPVVWTNNFTSLVGACSNTGNAFVTFTASDECGNPISTTAQVTVVDTQGPTFTTPASNMQVDCTNGTAAQDLAAWLANNTDANATNGGAIATDNCSGSGSVVGSYVYFISGGYNADGDNNPFNDPGVNSVDISDVLIDGQCNNGNVLSVDYYAIDPCGNVGGPTTGTFSVFDNTPPTITQQPAPLQVNCNLDAAQIMQAYNDWIANNGGATAFDGCSAVTWTANPEAETAGSCGGKRQRFVSWTVMDDCGNSVTTERVLFEVIDFTPPSIPGATSITEECGPGGNFGTFGQTIGSDQAGLQDWIDTNGYMDPALISDNCSEPVYFQFDWEDSNGNVGGSQTTPVYPTIDASNCNWAVTVTFRVFDQCNREATSQASFTIFDNVPPAFASAMLPDFNVNANQPPACDFDVTNVPLPSVSDNCTGSGSLIVTFVDSAPVFVPCDPVTHVFQQITRTWTVQDGCGLTATMNQNIGVTDFNPPRVQFPPNATVDCSVDFSEPANTGGGILAISDGAPVNNGTRNADCNDVSITWVDGPLDCTNGSGTFTRIWSVSDACGNAVPDYTQFITVTDFTPPTIDIVADDVDWNCGGDGTFCGFTDDPQFAFDCWIETIAYYAAASDNCSGIVNLPVGTQGTYGNGTGSGSVIFYTDPVSGNLLPTSWCAWMSPMQPDFDGNLVPTYTAFTQPAFLPLNNFCPARSAAMVDFVVKDDCGNTNVTTATWSITDDEPPVLTNCPTDVTINTSSNGTGDCSAELTFTPPFAFDNCGNDQSPCGPIGFTVSGGGQTNGFADFTGAIDPNVIINPLTINFSIPGPPTLATSPVTLNLNFVNLDGEFINTGHTEFFFVIGDDGTTILGQTAPTATQCGDLPNQAFTIPAATFNQWALDGIVSITLQPNNPGAGLENLAINNTCGGTSVQPSLDYNCSTPPGGNMLTYTVDYDCDGVPDVGPSPVSYPTITETFFGPSTGSGSVMTGSGSLTGTSCVTFTATDCEGNTTNCSFNITVADDEPPMITSCPTLPTTLNTPDCEAVCIDLPRPSNVVDNCQVMNFNQEVPFNSMTFTAHPNITGFILDTTTVNFNLGASPPPSSAATVTIEFKGDIDNLVPNSTTPVTAGPQELMEVYLGTNFIGMTTAGPHCSPNFTTIGNYTIPLSTLMAYYNTTGSIDLTVAPVYQTLTGFGNDGDANNDDFGINPCVAPGTFADDVSVTNVTDNGATMMRVSIDFEASAFMYCIDTQFDQFDVVNAFYPADGSTPEICLPPGMNTVKIKAMDAAGNIDSTSCVNSILVTAPSLGSAAITANMTSFNCPGDLVILDETSGYSGSGNAMWNWYQDNAPAGQGPEDILVGTTATPQIAFPAVSGTNDYYVVITDNLCVSNPSAPVTITTLQTAVNPVVFASPNPICEGESFGLFISNPQMTWVDYAWTGPNGYTSNLAQPAAITNANSIFSTGNYELCVTDINGCTVCGSVFVSVGAQSETPTIVSNSPICDGDPIILSTSTVCDSYTWIGPGGSSSGTLMNPLLNTLVGTTTIPAGDDAYLQGMWTLICQNSAGCSSESAPIEVVISPPIAVAASASPSPACAGDDIMLSASTTAGAIGFSWTGPNGFASGAQNPVIGSADSDDEGNYVVVVTDANGCTGTGSVNVTVGDGVSITAISYNPGPGSCVNMAQDLQFMVSEFPVDPGCYTYQWTGPDGFVSITKNAIIPNVTAEISGSYILTIFDCDGCASAPFEVVVDLADMPSTPILSVDNRQVCEGDMFTLSTQGYVGNIVTYSWSLPGGGGTQTSAPSLTIDPASLTQGGGYSVIVTVDGCPSNTSDTINVTVTPQPDQPVVSGPAVVCEGGSLQLSTDFVMGATYEWSGPGFTSSVQNPVIFPVNITNSGAYTVIVSVNGCESEVSDPLLVTVSEGLDAPTIASDGPTCIDDPNAALTLSVTTPTAGATYEWFSVENGTSIGTSGITPTFTITDFGDYGPGEWNFTVICDLNGCPSSESIPVTVTFDQIPAGINADAGPDVAICDVDNANLSATQPTVGIGTWSQVGGAPASISNSTDPGTSVTGLTEGTYIFRWTLSNGACADYSSDDMILVVNSSDCDAFAGGPYEVCEDTETTLAAEAACTGSTGMWVQSSTQASAGVVIADPSDPNTLVTGLESGNTYEFDWVLSNDGCGEYATSTALVTVSDNNNTPFAGPDQTLCGEEIFIDAADPGDCIGTWSSADPNVTFANANNPSTLVFGLTPGENTLIWSLSCGSCPSSSDEVIITFESAPEANNDSELIDFASAITSTVVDNDVLPAGGYTVTVIDEPENGTVEMNSDGTYTYTSDVTQFASTDQFTYELCSNSCPDVCVTAIVAIGIDIGDECTPPTIFTPNGDNTNDAFVIPCLFELSKYPDNEVVIFNQWGDEVYRSQPYLNDWMGTYNGEDLPVGTYFYIIYLNDGSDPISGFLVLER